MLVGNRTKFTAVRIRISDKSHLYLHPNAKRKRSYVERVASDPRVILRARGDQKENLKLYVSLVTRGKYNPVICGNRRQQMIKEAIERKKTAWKNLAKRDIYGYDKLVSILDPGMDFGPEISLKRKIMGMLKSSANRENTSDERRIINGILKSEKGITGDISFALRVHYDFCTRNKTTSSLSSLDREYGKMLNFILYDRPEEEMDLCNIDHPFYNEVALFNLFVKCKDNVLELDREALKKNVFHTINERGIRDFIGGKVERLSAAREDRGD